MFGGFEDSLDPFALAGVSSFPARPLPTLRLEMCVLVNVLLVAVCAVRRGVLSQSRGAMAARRSSMLALMVQSSPHTGIGLRGAECHRFPLSLTFWRRS